MKKSFFLIVLVLCVFAAGIVLAIDPSFRFGERIGVTSSQSVGWKMMNEYPNGVSVGAPVQNTIAYRAQNGNVYYGRGGMMGGVNTGYGMMGRSVVPGYGPTWSDEGYPRSNFLRGFAHIVTTVLVWTILGLVIALLVKKVKKQ